MTYGRTGTACRGVPRSSRGTGYTRVRRVIWGVLFILAAVYVGLALIGYAVQDSLVFPRSMANAAPMAAPPVGVEVLRVETEPGVVVEGWLLEGEGRSADSPGPAVVFLHGNAERIDNCLDHAREYQRRGFTVLLPEYRGYGNSGGKPSQRGIVQDVLSMHRLLIARPEVDGEKVIYHGRSLGGGVAAQVAVSLEHPPAAMVLESTFTSITSFASRYFIPGFLVRHPFRTDRVLPEIACPVLLLHGTGDRVVPIAHSRALARLAQDATLVEMSGGHNDFPHDWAAYWDQIDRFLGTAMDR